MRTRSLPSGVKSTAGSPGASIRSCSPPCAAHVRITPSSATVTSERSPGGKAMSPAPMPALLALRTTRRPVRASRTSVVPWLYPTATTRLSLETLTGLAVAPSGPSATHRVRSVAASTAHVAAACAPVSAPVMNQVRRSGETRRKFTAAGWRFVPRVRACLAPVLTLTIVSPPNRSPRPRLCPREATSRTSGDAHSRPLMTLALGSPCATVCRRWCHEVGDRDA